MSETNALGVPYKDLEPVVWSYLQARADEMSDSIVDPIRSYPILISEDGNMADPFKRAIMTQIIKQSGSGKRLDRIKNESDTMWHDYMRKLWIVERWISFRLITDEITKEHMNEIGLCYLTDETASDVIEHAFPYMGEFSRKQFEDFRKKHGLIQVPLAYRRSGAMIQGALKINRIGRRRI